MSTITLVNEQKIERVIPAYISRPRNKRVKATVEAGDTVEQIIKINGEEIDAQKYVVDGEPDAGKKVTAVSTLDFVDENDVAKEAEVVVIEESK